MASTAFSIRQLFLVAETIVVAVGGGIGFTLLDLPASWLSGAMLFTAIAALAGRTMLVPQMLARICFVALGISLGSVASPETIAGMRTWPLSIGLVCVGMGAVTAGTITYLRRVHGWDTQTAMLASIPGALSQVMAHAAELGADLRAIGIVQSLRLLILSVCIPSVLTFSGLAAVVRLPSGQVTVAEAPGEFVLLVVGCSVAAMVLRWIRFPGAFLFGPLTVSAFVHGLGIVHLGLPSWVASVAMVVLGAVAGSRFTGTPLRLLASYFAAGLGAFTVSLAIAGVFAIVAATLCDLRMADVVIAYAPGALDVMMILALALHLDPVFVGAHHLARFFTVTLAMPVLVRYLGTPSPKTKSGRPAEHRGDSLDD
jgi:uncharacterized protein